MPLFNSRCGVLETAGLMMRWVLQSSLDRTPVIIERTGPSTHPLADLSPRKTYGQSDHGLNY